MSNMDTQNPDQPVHGPAASSHLPFPIAGIGASAGGFAALDALLRHLPPSPGMALVIVLHLPSGQHSNADKILQRSTSLPVVQVNHAMPVLPDHVYVVPPGHAMTMEAGGLALHALDAAPGDPSTIDRFFRTLAAVQREQAIGVILSAWARTAAPVWPASRSWAAW